MGQNVGSYAASFSTSLKMMFANAGVIYKALGIPVNSFTVTITLESTPTDATHWSTRDLAKADRCIPVHRIACLACLQSAAASGGDLSALQRPTLWSRRYATSWVCT